MKLALPPGAVIRILRFLAAFFFGATVFYGLGPLVPALRPTFGLLPFAINSGVKVALMGMLCLYASGNLRRRSALILIVIVAHLFSISSTIGFIVTADVGGTVGIGPFEVARRTVLWGSVGLDSGITLLTLWLYLSVRPLAAGPGWVWPATPADRWLRVVLFLAAPFFAAQAILYQVAPLTAARPYFIELPFVGMAAVKFATLAILVVYVGLRTGERLPLVAPVIVAHWLSALFAIVLLVGGRPTQVIQIGSFSTSLASLIGWQIAVDGAVVALLWWLCRVVWQARYHLEFFSPKQFRTLLHVARVVVLGTNEVIPHWAIARNTERYLSKVRARRRWTQQVAMLAVEYHPLLYLKPPLSELDPEQCLSHLKLHFEQGGTRRSTPDWLRRLVQVLIRLVKQLCYIGYYSDARTWPSVGYVPFSKRPRARQIQPAPPPYRLDVLRPADIAGDVVEADVCVVGSGAAGAMLAYHLAKAGREVLVLERGRYIVPRRSAPPGETGFSEDEVEMVGRLYADGVFQQSEDWRFTVLQASCVGGTSVVNNAVSFAPPERVLNKWNAQPLDAGLDLPAVVRSVQAVSSLLSIGPQDGDHLNPSGGRFVAGAAGLGISPPFNVAAVRANIRQCLGCGYCNIGCAFDRKLSMLDTMLPWAQRDFPGRVRILADCEVERIVARSGSPERVVAVQAEFPDGRRVSIRAKTFVLSAGAVASSYLLIRSHLGRSLPVGRRLSFNMGSPITAEFDEVLNSYDGLQISHYAVAADERGEVREDYGYVLETWWNPPVTQALSMPGWFEDHFENMRRYSRMMGIGVLVGTEANASVRSALTGGPGIVFTPQREDMKKLVNGLIQAGKIAFAGGAKRVMASTWDYDVFKNPTDLYALGRVIDDPSLITLGTGHPQGGNAMSQNPKRGVVGPDFRVHGFANLFICDASVLPSSLTVNPQLTVMALAHYAAPGIAAA